MKFRFTNQPLLWVPSSFFAMGLVNQILVVVAAIMFRNLGMSYTEAAAYASQFYLAYAMQPLLAPLVDTFKSRKFYVIGTQIFISLGFGLVALCLQLSVYAAVVIALLWLISIAGSIQDVASNGVYLNALDNTRQAKFIGLQSLSWGIGPIVGAGLMVSYSGTLYASLGDWVTVWQIIFALLSLILLLVAVFHYLVLPPDRVAVHPIAGLPERKLATAFTTFFKKEAIVKMIAFAFFYRFSQGLLEKIIPFFMMDPISNGGLGLDNTALGKINSLGFSAFLLGSILGGWYIAKCGLKPSLLTLCLAVNIPNIFYLLLSIYQPDEFWLIATVIPLEKFFFGMGATGHMVYMMQQLAPGAFRTTHYAFGTGLMGLCLWSMGSASGLLVELLGYRSFFVVVLVAAVPSLLVTWWAPFRDENV